MTGERRDDVGMVREHQDLAVGRQVVEHVDDVLGRAAQLRRTQHPPQRHQADAVRPASCQGCGQIVEARRRALFREDLADDLFELSDIGLRHHGS